MQVYLYNEDWDQVATMQGADEDFVVVATARSGFAVGDPLPEGMAASAFRVVLQDGGEVPRT